MVHKNQVLKIANTIGLIVTVVVNGAANILPLNGVTTGELSDKYANLFTPAGYVFSIWSVIYTLLFAFVAYQFLFDDEKLQDDLGWSFVCSSFFNSIWIFLWHYEYLALSVVAMFGLLGSLIMIYQRLRVGLVQVPTRKLIMVHITFSVYLGWITVAPIANMTALLVGLGWPAFNNTAIYITSMILLVALLLTVINTYQRGDVAYAAVILWALGGILQKQLDTFLVPWVAGSSMIVLLVVLLLKKTGRLNSLPKPFKIL
jgi:hypothetical protein